MGKSIIKVSFKAGGTLGVKISYKTFDDNGPKGITKKEEKNVPHETFNKAMQGLLGHFLIKTESTGKAIPKKYKDLEVTERHKEEFRICGITIHGEAEKEGIIMTGYRTLSDGSGYVFNSPNIRVEAEGENAYPFIDDLLAAVETVKSEADEYLRGKFGIKQGELFETPAEVEE